MFVASNYLETNQKAIERRVQFRGVELVKVLQRVPTFHKSVASYTNYLRK